MLASFPFEKIGIFLTEISLRKNFAWAYDVARWKNDSENKINFFRLDQLLLSALNARSIYIYTST